MMAQQVQQSEETTSTLATSSRTVLETHEEFKAMTGTIQLGRKLIIKYNRRELTDKLLIFLALVLFLATVLYILKKRLSFLLNTDQSMSNQYDARRETHLQP